VVYFIKGVCIRSPHADVRGLVPLRNTISSTLGPRQASRNLAVGKSTKDRVGFIWVSTEKRYLRYDGERFEAFGPEQGFRPLRVRARRRSRWISFGWRGLRTLPLSGNVSKSFQVAFKNGQLGTRHPVKWKRAHLYWHGLRSCGALFRTWAGWVCGAEVFPKRRNIRAGCYGGLVDGDILWYGCGEELVPHGEGIGQQSSGETAGLPNRVCLGIQKDRDGNLWVRAKNAGMFVLPVGQKPDFEGQMRPFPAARWDLSQPMPTGGF